MTDDTRRLLARAIEEAHTLRAGGCWRAEEDDPEGECADGDCRCIHECREEAEACLAALRDAGLAVVPREPTQKMMLRGQTSAVPLYKNADAVMECYRAMVTAADSGTSETRPVSEKGTQSGKGE